MDLAALKPGVCVRIVEKAGTVDAFKASCKTGGKDVYKYLATFASMPFLSAESEVSANCPQETTDYVTNDVLYGNVSMSRHVYCFKEVP